MRCKERKKNRLLYLITVTFVASLFLSGWTGTWEDIRKESDKIQSISSEFIQTKHMDILSKPLVSKGNFYFKIPDSVRWEYASPVKSILLMHRGTVKKYISNSQSFIEDTGFSLHSGSAVLQEISSWSKGQFDNNKNFSAVLKSDTMPKIILVPKDKMLQKIIESIEITLMPNKNGAINSITISEGGGNYTVIQFSNVQYNVSIDDSIFQNP
jgi:outer membrane lipoprotein-sorting protein